MHWSWCKQENKRIFNFRLPISGSKIRARYYFENWHLKIGNLDLRYFVNRNW